MATSHPSSQTSQRDEPMLATRAGLALASAGFSAGGAVNRQVIPAPSRTSRVMASLKTYIVEDSPVIRENLIATLEEMVPLQVVGTADDESSAAQWLTREGHDCDLVIIDIFLKQGSGLGVLQAARHAVPESRLVVLSNYATPDMRRKCAELGADKVFDKSNEIDALISYCIRLANGGGDSGNSTFSALA